MFNTTKDIEMLERKAYQKGYTAKADEMTDWERAIRTERATLERDFTRKLTDKEIEFAKKLSDVEITHSKKVNELNNKIASHEFNHSLDVATDVKEKTDAIVDENVTLRERTATAEAKNSVIETAFREMGLDVKDTKDMIDKLIAGLVEKNNIQLVPTTTNTTNVTECKKD